MEIKEENDMTDIKIGFIGLGSRGANLLEDIVLGQGEHVTAVCDSYADRAENGAELVNKAGQDRPHVYTDAEDVIRDEEVNTVIIASAWESHVEIAIAAMYAGKAVAMEVGGAYTLNQCWDLVKAYEETKTPFMFLENCCFGRREMMVLNMVQQGVFGEIVHCAGGYQHDLREEVPFGKENRHYRLRNYLARNCDNYPTHDLGPIAKILNINHGNRMLTLDTTLPRYYTRNFTVRGTAGMYEEVTDSVFLDREEDIAHDFDWGKTNINNAHLYEEQYEHPVWKEYLAEGVQGTHDGMDWLEFRTFFRALRENAPMPIDVYDAASWMAITVLSEMSIARGGAVVDIPDFTNGKWDSEILPRE